METDEQLLRLRYKPADLMRWEAALRRLGPEMVRLRFDERARPGAREDQAIPGLVAEAPHPPSDFVERWLRGQSLRVMSMRTVLPPICVALVLAVLSFLAWWTVSTALQNPIVPTGTMPTINDVISGQPPISQLYPPPGTTVPTTTTTTTTFGTANTPTTTTTGGAVPTVGQSQTSPSN